MILVELFDESEHILTTVLCVNKYAVHLTMSSIWCRSSDDCVDILTSHVHDKDDIRQHS